MTLSGRRGHIDGDKLKGTHTTVLNGIESILKKMSQEAWCESVRADALYPCRVQKQTLSIRRAHNPIFKQTLTLEFHSNGGAQKIHIKVSDHNVMEQAVQGMKEIMQEHYPDFLAHDYLHQATQKPSFSEGFAKGAALLKKWGNRNR